MNKEEQATSSAAARPFLLLAQHVERRLFLRGWLAALHKTSMPIFGLLLLALLAARLSGMADLPLIGRELLPAATVLALFWVAGCALYAHLRRPGHAAALALFDARNHGEEIFVSAFSFARDPRHGVGGDLHIRHAHAALERAAADVDLVLPVRVKAATGWAPVAFLLLAAFGLPALPAVPPVESATAEAALVGRSIDEEARSLENVDAGLTDQEQEKLKRLKQQLEKSAQKLSDRGQEKSPRDVLEELEERAAQAEALAALLDAEGEKVGSAMLAELERHADTAELASALRGQQLAAAAQEAGQLARRLRTKTLSLEARKRIERAFRGGLEAATPGDRKTLLGSHMSRAHSALKEEQPDRAAKEFDALARRYQQMLERKNVMQTLERLAENLRTSGQRALGGNRGHMQKIEAAKAGRLARAGIAQVGSEPARLPMEPRPYRAGAAGRASDSRATPTGTSPSGTSQTNASTPVPGSRAQPSRSSSGCEKCRAAQADRASSSPGSRSESPVPGTPPSGRSQPGGSPPGGT